MTFNLDYLEDMTRGRLALRAGELVPLDIDAPLSLHGKLREPTRRSLAIQVPAHMRMYADDQRCHKFARRHDKQELH